MANQEEELRKRVAQLEKEVRDREEDLSHYKEQLLGVNQKLEQLISNISHQLKTAQVIQKFLVPTEFRNISGIAFSYKFIPSAISGGDYFDIFEHEDRFRFGIVVASGAGHAMSSLLLSVLLKLTGKMEARRGAEPHKLVGHIFSELKESLSEESKADLFYAMIDRRSFELSFCRLGEVTAIHQDAATGELKVLPQVGDAISMEFSPPKGSEKVFLSPKDRIIIATPGVIETQNLEGEAFGIERLLSAIMKSPGKGVHETRNEVLMAVSKHGQGCEVRRDQTVLVAEVNDRVIKLAKSED